MFSSLIIHHSPFIIWLIILLTKKRSDHKYVHLRPEKTFDGLRRLTHDRLVLVEARVENDGDPGLLLEHLDQIVIQRILLACDRLQPTRIVHVVHGRETLSPL